MLVPEFQIQEGWCGTKAFVCSFVDFFFPVPKECFTLYTNIYYTISYTVSSNFSWVSLGLYSFSLGAVFISWFCMSSKIDFDGNVWVRHSNVYTFTFESIEKFSPHFVNWGYFKMFNSWKEEGDRIIVYNVYWK